MPAVGTQPTITVQPPSALVPVGTTRFNTTTIPAAYTTVTITLPRNAGWTASAGVEILELVAEFSADGGVTFPYAEGFGVAGGTISGIDKNGNAFTVTQHTAIRSIPIPTPCVAQGRLINHTGATLTALSVALAFN